ncbi:unnamed protein product [Plutella xylostella]|uniref:Glyoxylate reductase/hydroxypyruvate reductase n=1 Tax=Plutella xylostella TaxID=51655 RepID=A0A8S4FNP0_PLUXY|nr:unnamed protein product [Plutella xylostella]
MVMKRVLIANKSYPAAGLELLKKKVECLIVPHLDHEPESLQEIKKQIKGVDAVIWNVKHKFTKEILDIAGPNLKAISTMSTGLDHIDQDAVKAHGVLIGNTPNVLNNSVADIAIGVMIAAARRFKEGVADLESGEWKYGVNWTLGQDIAGSTVGIVGLGSIGQAIVRRLKGFDVARFLYTGRSDKPEAISLGAERVSLDKLLKESDYVMLGCPFTPETKHLINKEALNKMKRSAVLVNYARGEIVDQEALYEALKEKRIFAAGLDVVTPEPLPKDHPLISLPNCFIVPHLGSATYATRNTMSTIAANNVLLALDGKPMQCPVNY